MAAVANEYPLLKATILTNIVREFKTDTSTFKGATWCPAQNYLRDQIEWDILYGPTGMTPAVMPDAPSPIAKHPRIGHASFATVQWREKVVFGETDLTVLRRPGTWDEVYGNELIARAMSDLNVRIETRMEYLRYAMLAGEIEVTYENGPEQVSQTIDYKVPTANKPTVTTLWSNHAQSDPVKDIAALQLLFRGSASQAAWLELNQLTYNDLPANAAIRNLIQYSFGYDLVRSGGLVPQGAIEQALGGLPLRINDSGYVGDDDVFNLFVPDRKLLVMGTAPEQRADFAMTPNLQHGGQTPQPGKFARPIFFLDADPIRVEVIGGVYGLPRFMHPNWHLWVSV